jgi:hypothetical protein
MEKFLEPRWEGTALFPAADRVPRDDGARGAAAPSVGWALQWRQVVEEGMPGSRNGIGRNGLTRPRGWALQWAGSALTGSVEGDEPASLWAIEREDEGAI